MTFDIGLHEVCVRTGVRYVITKFSGMDSLPNFLTHGAPLRALGISAINAFVVNNSSPSISLQVSSPGRSGRRAGKGSRAYNYVFRI